MQVTATETVIGVATPGGTVIIASPGFNPEHFAEVVNTLHPNTDVDLESVAYVETDNGGAVWHVPPQAIGTGNYAPIIDLTEGLEESGV